MYPMCPICAHFRAQSWAHLKSYFIKQISLLMWWNPNVVLVKMFEIEIHDHPLTWNIHMNKGLARKLYTSCICWILVWVPYPGWKFSIQLISFYSFISQLTYLLFSPEFSTRVWGGDCSDVGFSTLMASYGMTKLARDLNSSK